MIKITKKIIDHFLTDFFSFCILVLLSLFLINNFASAKGFITSDDSQNFNDNTSEKSSTTSRKHLLKTDNSNIKKNNSQLKKKRKINSTDSEIIWKNSNLKIENSSSNKSRTSNEINYLAPYFSNYAFRADLSFYQDKNLDRNYLNISNTFYVNHVEDIDFKFYLNYLNKLNYSTSSDFSDFYTHFYFSSLSKPVSKLIRPYLVSVLPFSKDSQQNQKLNLALGGGIEGLSTFAISTFQLQAKLNLSLIKPFHRNQYSSGNISNLNYLSNQQGQLQTFFNNYLSLGLVFKRTQGINYNEQQIQESSFKQQINLSLNKNFTFTFGHSDSVQFVDEAQEEITLIQDQSKTSIYHLGMKWFVN